MSDQEKRHAAAVEALVKMANAAAENAAKSTGAPYAVVLLSGGDGPLIVGCWVPKPEIARKMLADALGTFDRDDGDGVIRRDLGRERRDTYELGAQLTHAIVKAWIEKADPVRFAFPPREIALVADLRQVGQKLARNESARQLVDQLNEHVVSVTGHAPTAMMLRVILEDLGVEIEWVPPSELGLQVPTS